MEDLDECPRCGLSAAWRGDASGKCVKCYWPDGAQPDPRDAEIARLKGERDGARASEASIRASAIRHDDANNETIRVLTKKRDAAGPAARALASRSHDEGQAMVVIDRLVRHANIVEAAQEAAMKEGK